MTTDLRGVPVTGADTFALARYESALGQFQSYVGDSIATIDEVSRRRQPRRRTPAQGSCSIR